MLSLFDECVLNASLADAADLFFNDSAQDTFLAGRCGFAPVLERQRTPLSVTPLLFGQMCNVSWSDYWSGSANREWSHVAGFRRPGVGSNPGNAIVYAGPGFLFSFSFFCSQTSWHLQVRDKLVNAATTCGVEVRCDTEVSEVVVNEGRVTGVALSTGEHVAADIVLVNRWQPVSQFPTSFCFPLYHSVCQKG